MLLLLLLLLVSTGWVGPVAGITNTSNEYVQARAVIEGISAQIHQLDALAQAQTALHQHNNPKQQMQSKRPQKQQQFEADMSSSQHQQQQALTINAQMGQISDSCTPQFMQEQQHLLKQQRKALSHSLLEQIQESYHTQSVDGQPLSLLEVYLQYVQQYDRQLPVTKAGAFRGFPAGVGDCCAPKLLHAAAVAGLRPVALAELWCGSPPGTATKAKLGRPIVLGDSASRQHLAFYGMCDKCKAILGTMLCGINDVTQCPQ